MAVKQQGKLSFLRVTVKKKQLILTKLVYPSMLLKALTLPVHLQAITAVCCHLADTFMYDRSVTDKVNKHKKKP